MKNKDIVKVQIPTPKYDDLVMGEGGWGQINTDKALETVKDQEIELYELKKWKEEALKFMNQWNEVSDYINLNAEVEDLGRFIPQICLKYLKERDEMKKQKSLWEEDALRYCNNADFWRDKYEKLVKVIAENTFIPKAVIPMLREFPDIVQSEITPVQKEK